MFRLASFMHLVYNNIVKTFTLHLRTIFQGHWKQILAVIAVIIVIVLAGLIAWGLYLRSQGASWANWTGFGDYQGSLPKDDRGKTLWDWMGLLLVPIVVGAAAGFWFYFQQRAEGKRADIRAALEREIALDRQREEAMRSYFDKIGQLLMEKDLLKGTKEAAIRDYAQILTITALRSLDVDRKNMVLQFLRDANLAGFILASASLAHCDLKYTNMFNINLKLANLSEANLSGAYLYKANLYGAKLVKANLSEAKLAMANLIKTNLEEAILTGALLLEANLTGAYLIGAILTRANLIGADLFGANLNRANLTDANLTDANLGLARLTKANLTGAVGITEEQISQAILYDTTMPDGSVRSNNQANK